MFLAPKICAFGDVLETVFSTPYYKAELAGCDTACKSPEISFKDSPYSVFEQHYSKNTFIRILPVFDMYFDVIHMYLNVSGPKEVVIIFKQSDGEEMTKNFTVS